ncbi:uncharacterized protein LOC135925860 isoform X1 [Gordionus sp. m RMFG-2023]|uniref:uncharacterized protein LOC135925860 isoform X1 n=1 Tax=Gordionus sp. m RMFG-2023 TaxID=3053472 RepID=UPI0031FE00E5
MTTYWKSQPKKFCELCKCWFSDNANSSAIHEKGLNHKENLKRKIQQISENKVLGDKQQNAYEKCMMQIEKAAMKSFKRDLENDSLIINELDSGDNEGKKGNYDDVIVERGPINKPLNSVETNNASIKTYSKTVKTTPKRSLDAPFIGKWKTVKREDSVLLRKENDTILSNDCYIDLQLPNNDTWHKNIFYTVVEDNIKNSEGDHSQGEEIIFAEKRMDHKSAKDDLPNLICSDDQKKLHQKLVDKTSNNEFETLQITMVKRKKRFCGRTSQISD